MRAVLEGVKVLDFTRMHAGAGGTRLLANFGADVIRVEWPHYPALDFVRFVAPFAEGKSGANRAVWFNSLNVGKKSVTINARHPKGLDLLKRLAMQCDIVAENFSPGVLDKWGLGYEQLKTLKPDIIYLGQPGFGYTGPYKNYRTFGNTAQAYGALTITAGLPGKVPSGWGFSYMDHMAGWTAALAVAMALHHRNRTGEGQFIDLPQGQSACTLTGVYQLDFLVNGRAFMADPGNPPGNRSWHPRRVPHNAYRCAGGGFDDWCVIDVETDEQWASLVEIMGRPAWSTAPALATLAGRIEAEEEIDRGITAWTSGLDKFTVMRLLQEAGIPSGAVQNAGDKFERDPHLAARSFYQKVPHAEIGEHYVEGPVVKMSRTPPAIQGPGPILGEHTAWVCREYLGLGDDDLAELAAEDAIAIGEVVADA